MCDAVTVGGKQPLSEHEQVLTNASVGALTNLDSQEHTYSGVAHPLASATAPKGDMVQHRHIVANHSSLTNHHASGMINQNTFAKLGSRVNVNVQHL